MTANFYKNSANMHGIDMHHAYILPPLSPSEVAKGHLMTPWPFLVQVKLSDPGGDEAKRTPTVTADGEMMIRDGFVHHKVTHFTPVPFLHPYQNSVETPKIEASSTTTPLLKSASVSSGGDLLSVCGLGWVGANLNCQEEGVKVTGVVFCVCSVQTSPQAKDLIFRLFDDFFKKMLVDWVTGTLDKLLEGRRIPSPVRSVVKWLAEKAVKQFLDWLEILAKWSLDKATEPPKLPPPEEEPPKLPPLKEEPPVDWEKEEQEREKRQQKQRDERNRKRNNPWWDPF